MTAKPLPSLEVLNETFVCDADAGTLSWKTAKPGRRKTKAVGSVRKEDGYVKVRIFGSVYHVHRIIWKMVTGREPSAEIDHISGERGNNRFCNLREATTRQNGGNRRAKRNSSGFKGVAKNWSGKWVALVGGKYVGIYPTPELAHEAYWKRAQEVYGEFARRE